MHSTDGTPAPSLDEFAPRPKTTCTVCNLPPTLLRQVNEGRLRDPRRFTYPVISRWLETVHAQEVSDTSLRRHFNRSHDRREADGGAEQ